MVEKLRTDTKNPEKGENKTGYLKSAKSDDGVLGNDNVIRKEISI